MLQRQLVKILFMLAMSTCAGMVFAQQTIQLSIASGHPMTVQWVRILDEIFIPDIDNRLVGAGGKYKIEWKKSFGGSRVKLGNESRAVADGVADFGLVSTAVESVRFPLQTVSYRAPFGSDDIEAVSAVVGEIQNNVDEMNEVWSRHGLTYLAGMALESYQLLTKFPIKHLEDLQGKRISAPGLAAPWLRSISAVPVPGTLHTYCQDIEAGFSEGALVFATGAGNTHLHEVAPFITKINFGAMFAGALVVNKSRFDNLPQEVQDIIRDASQEWSRFYVATQSALAQAHLQYMIEGGARVSELSALERKRWKEAVSSIGKTWTTSVQDQPIVADEVLSAYTSHQLLAPPRPTNILSQ